MKNKLAILIILLLAFSQNLSVFASDAKVVSDSEKQKQKELLDEFNSVNQYTNGFFTPHINTTAEDKDAVPEKKDLYTEAEIERQLNQHNTLTPVKKLRLNFHKQMILSKKNHTSLIKGLISKQNKNIQAQTPEPQNKEQADILCDTMQYFAPQTELEADGHVVMTFPQNNSTIKADKMVYNQTTNLIKAFGNVVLINGSREMHGDFMQIDMNEENALMDKPVTDYFQIRAKAQKGYLYGDKLIQDQGNIMITKKTMVDVKSDFFGPDLDTMIVDKRYKSYLKKDSHGDKLKIKTDELIINSKKEHDTVTLKHATLFFGEKKLGTIPSITMHTNKSQDFAEANFPELGTMTNLGLYAGPGFVFDTPKGSTLKVVPILNYQGNGDTGDSSFGWGGIAKFKNATNKTDFAYGTANKVFLMRGLQKLDDNLYFQYAANSYMDDWFMGFRLPKFMTEIVYQETADPIKNFLGKGKDMLFTQRVTGGYMQDGPPQSALFDNEGGIGTARFKYMAEAAQTIYKWGDVAESPINARLELVGQASTAIYGTGDTQMVGRIGPRIHTQYKNWMQDTGYFMSTFKDNSPLGFDRYVYGRSNVYARESFRLCKYLTLSWLGSLNLSQDSWDGKMMQENTFFFAIGPDDIKLNIGYDTIRQQSFVTMTMHLDAKGSQIDYKKMVIKNPDTLGKTDRQTTDDSAFTPISAFSVPSSDNYSTVIEHAQVIDIPTSEAL